MMPGGITSLHFDHCVFNTDVFENNVFFEEKPVSDANPDFASRKNGVLVLVFDQHTTQVHIVEE